MDDSYRAATTAESLLLTDLYQLTMLQAYHDRGMTATAVFEFYVRRLPAERNFLVAAGLEQVVEFLATAHFTEAELEWLAGSGYVRREVVDALAGWRGASPRPPDALVFPGVDGERMEDVKTAWASITTAAAIADFRFHDLRHTFASKLVQAGVDLNTVRELLGHADIKMTLRYAHLAPELKATAVAKLVRA